MWLKLTSLKTSLRNSWIPLESYNLLCIPASQSTEDLLHVLSQLVGNSSINGWLASALRSRQTLRCWLLKHLPRVDFPPPHSLQCVRLLIRDCSPWCVQIQFIVAICLITLSGLCWEAWKYFIQPLNPCAAKEMWVKYVSVFKEHIKNW